MYKKEFCSVDPIPEAPHYYSFRCLEEMREKGKSVRGEKGQGVGLVERMTKTAKCETMTWTMLADGIWGERGGDEGEERAKRANVRGVHGWWIKLRETRMRTNRMP